MREIAVPCIFLVLIGKSGEISSTFHRIFWEIFAGVLGGIVAGICFLIELEDLKGRELLEGYPVYTLIQY